MTPSLAKPINEIVFCHSKKGLHGPKPTLTNFKLHSKISNENFKKMIIDTTSLFKSTHQNSNNEPTRTKIILLWNSTNQITRSDL